MRPSQVTDSFFEDCIVLHESDIASPLVSVVVPVYNEGESGFLSKCIDSLIHQSLDALEVVFVDDASSDDSLDILLRIAESTSNISVLHMTQNSRQGAARNRGVSFARGEYIGFMDSDDVVDPEFYEALYIEAKKSNAEMVEAPLMRVDSSGRPISNPMLSIAKSCLGRLDTDKRRHLIGHTPCCVQCILKASFLKDARRSFPEGMVYEDTPTMVRWIYDLSSISQIAGVCYYYRFNPHSTCQSTSQNHRFLENRIQSSDMLISEAKECGWYEVYRDEIDAYYFKVCGLITLATLCNGDKALSMDCCNRVIAHVSEVLGTEKVRALLCSGRLSFVEHFRVNLLWHFPAFYNILVRNLKRFHWLPAR